VKCALAVRAGDDLVFVTLGFETRPGYGVASVDAGQRAGRSPCAVLRLRVRILASALLCPLQRGDRHDVGDRRSVCSPAAAGEQQPMPLCGLFLVERINFGIDHHRSLAEPGPSVDHPQVLLGRGVHGGL